MSLRDVTIARDGKRGLQMRMTSRTGSARRILGDLKVRVELMTASGEDGWLSFACEGLGLVSHEMGWGQMKKPE